MPKQIVYVHGAGPQKPAAALKHDIDIALFGKDVSASRLAWYANVRWPSAAATTGAGVGAALGGANRKRRTKAIRDATDPSLSVNDAANEIVDATFAVQPVLPMAAAAAGATPADIAQRIARRPALPARRPYREPVLRRCQPRRWAAEPRRWASPFPDPISVVVGRFASDVIDYLYGPFKQAMRAPSSRRSAQNPRPKSSWRTASGRSSRTTS